MNRFTTQTTKALLGAAVALSIFAFAPATEAATSGNIALNGIVAARCDITVTPTAAATGMDLDSVASDVTVANVNEDCNDPDGYTVTMDTANGTTSGQLDSVATGDSLAYTVKYDGGAVSFSSSTATVTDVTSNTAAGGVDKAVQISYTPDSGIAAGNDYNDTLTLTIAVK